MRKPPDPPEPTHVVEISDDVSYLSLAEIIKTLPDGYPLENTELIAYHDYYSDTDRLELRYTIVKTYSPKELEGRQKQYEKDLEEYEKWQQEEKDRKKRQAELRKMKKSPEYRTFLELKKKFEGH
jgi:hypothetical protein